MLDSRSKDKKKSHPRIIPVLIPTVAANIGTFFIGYSVGYPSPIEDDIKNLGILDSITYPIFSSFQYFTAIFGAILVYFLVESFGKKALLIIFTIPNALGWLLIAFGYNWVIMLLGRSLTGIAYGAISCLISVYVADLSPTSLKGFYGSFFIHMFLLGTLSSHFLGIFLTFRWLAVVCIFVLFIQVLLLFLQPYSPNWLVTQKQEKRALKTLQYLRGPSHDSRAEFDEIKHVVKENFSDTFCLRFATLFKETNYLKTIFKVALLFAFLELTGITIVGTYSATILKTSRLIPAKIASLIPTCAQWIAAFLCTFLVDRIGRKILLIMSSLGVALSHIINSVYFFGIDRLWSHCHTSMTNSSYPILSNSGVNSRVFCDYISLLPVIALIVLRASYGFGWGPIPWIVMGESLPIKVRSIGASVSVLFFLFFSGFQILLFPYLVVLLGAYVVYLIFLLINILSAIYVLMFIPETKNKSLEEIEVLFEGQTFFLPFKCRNLFEKSYVYVVNKD